MNAKRNVLALCIAVGSIAMLGSAPALAEIYVRIGPPPPRHQIVPVLRPGWAWQPGYWNWSGHRYVWVGGHQVHAHRGQHWTPHRWVKDHGRWRMEGGRWDRR